MGNKYHDSVPQKHAPTVQLTGFSITYKILVLKYATVRTT